MTNDRKRREEQLEAIRHELEKQQEEMKRLCAMAARLGDAQIAVPRDVLDRIIGKKSEPTALIMGVRA
jgi:hypothetical protein